MPDWVKDESAWAKAKARVQAEYPAASGDHFWRLVTAIYQRMMETKMAKSLPVLFFIKAHVSGYTRANGVYVRPHEDSRMAANTKTVDGIFDVLLRHVQGMGLDVDDTARSGLSRSHYLTVTHGVGPVNADGGHDDYRTYKLRISDHVLPLTYKMLNGSADFEVSPDGMEHDDTQGNWHQALAWLAKKTGIPLKGSAKRVHNAWLEARRVADEKRQAEERAAREERHARLTGGIGLVDLFDQWLNTLPDNVEIRLSNNGNVFAYKEGTPPGGMPIAGFGKKPDEFSKLFKTKADAKHYVENKRRELEFFQSKIS